MNMNLELNEVADLYANGSFEEALVKLQHLYEKRKSYYGFSHPRSSEIQQYIGLVYKKQCKYKDAYMEFRKVHEKRVRSFGPNHPETLTTWNFMALVLYELDKYDEALVIFKEVYAKRRCLLGPNHKDTLASRTGIAESISLLGKNALPIYEDIYEILKEENPEGMSTLVARRNMAEQLLQQGKYDKSLEIFNEVYAIQNRTETMYLDSLVTLHQIAIVYSKQGNHNDAMIISQKVYKIYSEVLGEDHPKTLHIYGVIGCLNIKQNRIIKGLEILEIVYNKRKEVLGEENVNTLRTEERIADVYSILERYETALPIYYKIHEIQKRLYPKHDRLAFKGIGYILTKQGKYDKALFIYRDYITEFQNTLGPDHPQILEIQNRIVELLFRKGNYDEALYISSKIDEILVKRYGPEHRETLTTQLDIATLLMCQEKYKESLKIYKNVLEIQKTKGIDLDNAEITAIHFNIAKIRFKLGDKD